MSALTIVLIIVAVGCCTLCAYGISSAIRRGRRRRDAEQYS